MPSLLYIFGGIYPLASVNFKIYVEKHIQVFKMTKFYYCELHASLNLEQTECIGTILAHFLGGRGEVDNEMRMRKAKILNHRVPVLS